MLHVSLMGTTKQKFISDTQKIKEKEINNTTIKNIIKSQRKRAKKKQNNYKTNRKQIKKTAIVSPHLSIIIG